MSLSIAKVANAIGLDGLADNITRISYGKPIGRVSKTGVRGYCFISNDGEKFYTTFDKNFNMLAQTIRSKTGNNFVKEIYDKSGSISCIRECSKTQDAIFHKITTPYDRGGKTGLWVYEIPTQKKVIFQNDENILNELI